MTREQGLSLLNCWWAMTQAQEELDGEPIPDDAVILHFSGSGASCMVTAEALRAALGGSHADK